MPLISLSVSIAEKQKNSVLQTLSWKIDTTDKQYGLPAIVFNPHSFDVEEVVTINNHVLSVKDSEGKDVEYGRAELEWEYVPLIRPFARFEIVGVVKLLYKLKQNDGYPYYKEYAPSQGFCDIPSEKNDEGGNAR